MRELPFDEILDEVASGRAEAGLLIHEGQLTYGDAGPAQAARPRRLVAGGDRRCRCRSESTSRGATSATGWPMSPRSSREAIRYGLEHRDEALAYAEGFGRGIDRETADRFVAMYVNELTCDYGEVGRRAVDELLRRSGSDVTAVRLASAGRRPRAVARATGGRSSPPARSPRPATRALRRAYRARPRAACAVRAEPRGGGARARRSEHRRRSRRSTRGVAPPTASASGP